MLQVTLSRVLSDPNGRPACMASALCAATSLFLLFLVSITRSLVITAAAWLSVFSFFAIFSAVISLSSRHSAYKSYTFGMVRAPVLATFSTTVLVQLASVFLIKEAVERLFEVGHHHGGSLPPNNHLYYYGAAAACTVSLLSAAYSVTNQPFNYVLRSAQSSVIQEHAADISHAICYVVPGLSRLLLPRINSLSLLALSSSTCCVLTHWFMSEFWWFDSIAVLALSFIVFSTMMPLSTYTGLILLQTTPPHIHNQIDRCISEASTVEGVLELRNAHFWQVDFNSIAGSVEVRVRRDANEQFVLCLVSEKLSTVVNILTVQIVKDVMNAWSGGGHAPVASYQWVNHLENQQGFNFHPSPPEAEHRNHDDGHGHSHSHDHSHNGHSHH